MTLTQLEALDAIVGFVDAAWKADALSAPVPMHYDNVRGDRPKDDGIHGADPFARTTLRTLESPQSTQGSAKRYLTGALLTVQVFTAIGDGTVYGKQLAEVVTKALRGHAGSAGGFWFSDVVATEIGESASWFQINVTANAWYQEVP